MAFHFTVLICSPCLPSSCPPNKMFQLPHCPFFLVFIQQTYLKSFFGDCTGMFVETLMRSMAMCWTAASSTLVTRQLILLCRLSNDDSRCSFGRMTTSDTPDSQRLKGWHKFDCTHLIKGGIKIPWLQSEFAFCLRPVSKVKVKGMLGDFLGRFPLQLSAQPGATNAGGCGFSDAWVGCGYARVSRKKHSGK